MVTIRNTLLAVALTTVAACGGGSGGDDPEPQVTTQSLSTASCQGTRIWDFGTSDVLQNGTSFISETFGFTNNSRFPCLAFWEYVPSANCSLLFTFEDYVAVFGIDGSLISEIGLSGSNLTIVGTNGAETTGTPATLSIQDLSNFPDCVLQ